MYRATADVFGIIRLSFLGNSTGSGGGGGGGGDGGGGVGGSAFDVNAVLIARSTSQSCTDRN
jgi:hypothetical protein